MLLHLESIKLWHLAQQHVNFDSALKHIVSYVSLENCTNSSKDKDNERFMQASAKKRSLCYQKNGEGNPLMINSHVKYFHLTVHPGISWSNHIPQNE